MRASKALDTALWLQEILKVIDQTPCFIHYCLFCRYLLSTPEVPGPAHASKELSPCGIDESWTSAGEGMWVVLHTEACAKVYSVKYGHVTRYCVETVFTVK